MARLHPALGRVREIEVLDADRIRIVVEDENQHPHIVMLIDTPEALRFKCPENIEIIEPTGVQFFPTISIIIVKGSQHIPLAHLIVTHEGGFRAYVPH